MIFGSSSRASVSQMKPIILALSLFALALLSLTAAKPSKWKCDEEDEKTVDTLVGRIMTFGRTDRQFPVNSREMKVYCKESTRMLAQLDDYKTVCLKGRPKQTVSILIYSMRNLANTYCKNLSSKRTKDLLASAHCANEATHDYLRCSDAYVDILQSAERLKDSKGKLGQICCGYVDIFRCIQTQAAKHKQICTDEKVEANSNYIRGFFENAINVACGEMNEGTDKCDKVKLLRGGKSKKSKAKPQSYFGSLVRLISNI